MPNNRDHFRQCECSLCRNQRMTVKERIAAGRERIAAKRKVVDSILKKPIRK